MIFLGMQMQRQGSYKHLSAKRETDIAAKFGILFIVCFVCVLISSIYVGKSNGYTAIWHDAKIEDIYVKIETTTSCSKHSCTTTKHYYINEKMQKMVRNSNGTLVSANRYCTIQRLWEYATFEAANSKVSEMKIGIGNLKDAYIYPSSTWSGFCLDVYEVKYYYNVGFWIGITSTILLIPFFWILITQGMSDWIEDYKERHGGIIFDDTFSNFTDEDLSKATNMSSQYMPRGWNLFWKFADTDESGTIDFMEFVTALWFIFRSLMSASWEALCDFCSCVFNTVKVFFAGLCICVYGLCMSEANTSSGTTAVIQV